MMGRDVAFTVGVNSLNICSFCPSLQIRMRDDGLPLAHIAIAVEGASAASPDIVPLMVANSIIGSYDLTYGGGKVGKT